MLYYWFNLASCAKHAGDPGWHRHWLTGFVEYDYYGFQNNSPSALVCAPGACGGVIVTNAVGVTTNINVVKVGLNLKFSLGGF